MIDKSDNDNNKLHVNPHISIYNSIDNIYIENNDCISNADSECTQDSIDTLDTIPTGSNIHNKHTHLPYSIPEVQMVSTGSSHTCFIHSKGLTHCIGWNYYGQATPPSFNCDNQCT